MRFKGVLQHDEKDCSAACLATICKYWKLNIPLVKLRELIKIDKNGANIYGIIQAASMIGLKGEALEGSWEELLDEVSKHEIKLPIIAHVIMDQSLEHFIVVYKISHTKVYAFDPGKGNVVYSIEEFISLWTGYIITITKTENFKAQNLLIESYRKYLKLIKKQTSLLISILVFSFIIVLISITSSLAFQKIVDQYAMGGTDARSQVKIFETLYAQVSKLLNGFVPIILALVGLYLIQILLEYTRGIFLAYLSKRIDKELMFPFYKKLMSLPVTFFQNRETGEIISRFQDISEIRNMISGSTLILILDSVMLVVGMIILLGISSKLFMIVLGIAVIYAFIVICFKKPLATVQRKVMENHAHVTSSLKEGVDGVENIKALLAEEENISSFRKDIEKYLETMFNGEKISQLLESLIMGVSGIGNLMIFAIGVYFVMIQEISMGNLIAFQGLVQYFFNPLKNLLMLQPMLQSATIAAERLNDIMEITSEKDIYIRKENMSFENVKIQFKNVNFQYGYREKVLKNVNLTINPGEKIAIVGESGCGKTTLVRLINAFYLVSEGEILFENKNSNEVDLECLRKKIAYVPQNPILFNTSIINNITYGLNEWDEEQLKEVIEQCGILEIINKMPLKEHTIVSENGKNLSGGQQQRIAIARALMKKPEIILVDEGTSQLDIANEMKITNYIFNNYKKNICIFIMHNYRMLERFDRVVYMNAGKIICTGKHEELLENSKRYRQLLEGK